VESCQLFVNVNIFKLVFKLSFFTLIENVTLLLCLTLFAESPSSQEVLESARVQLTCAARTDPRLAKSLVVDWYRNGVLLAPGPSILKTPENSLILLSAAVTDSGGYQCRASTMLGNLWLSSVYLDSANGLEANYQLFKMFVTMHNPLMNTELF
jgi:hypothetical protein